MRLEEGTCPLCGDQAKLAVTEDDPPRVLGCARCLGEALGLFPWEVRQAAAEDLRERKSTGQWCDDPACEACHPPSGCGGDGHIF